MLNTNFQEYRQKLCFKIVFFVFLLAILSQKVVKLFFNNNVPHCVVLQLIIVENLATL